MKTVFFGGGSFRFLGVARSALATPGLFEDGEINLYDLSVPRTETMGRMIMKTPEFRQARCRVRWGTTLDEALDGADVVLVVIMAGSRANHGSCELACCRRGFIGSDQLSPSGAVLALKGGPILMDLARRMERLCPNGWLIDFANPVAVLSAAVNNHTRVRCLGVCGGYTNHQWDLTRFLYGRDEQWSDYQIRCAGVNHLSFILPGSTHRGRDLHALMQERLATGWTVPVLSDRWTAIGKEQMAKGLGALANYYRKYGCLVFSTEGDGLAHLDIEGYYASAAARRAAMTDAEIGQADATATAARAEADRKFQSLLATEMDDAAWNAERSDNLYLLRADQDIMVKILKAVSGRDEVPIVTSSPNRGAVLGFKDRTVLEYSQLLSGSGLRPAGHFEIPDVVQGLIAGLATHQTLLGDAIAARDPRILFEAMYGYPVKQDTGEAKALWRELLEIAREEIPGEFQHTRELLR